ncbi:hypothetical protein SAMN06295905_0715 [Devosia lucknowensis]|uniref:SPW repeat-containing protein n=1 Tax=Devosia lucknowensis TaxID=1096929 RepID=A0A1Y6EJF9_9HYPH|nr:hypothetical protein [Devosia lucknowensis]SMQ62768.1 hypothetical protein SAMN06295905_0715 [Devosia lucknowensis]
MTTLTARAPGLDPHLPYLADVPVSAIMGLVLIFAAGPLTDLAGWSLPPSFFMTLGVILLPWAAYNLLIARKPRPAPALVWSNIAVDLSWALGSFVLVAVYWSELTGLGAALLCAQGLAVGAMFMAKLLGVRALLC